MSPWTKTIKRAADRLLGVKPEEPKPKPAVQPRKAQKVFCIGLSKTATTSFGVATRRLGYKTSSWHKRAGTFVVNWHEGRFTEEMQAVVAANDAFEDLPWPLLFKILDKHEPNAKFVLTLRKSPEVWLASMQKHVSRYRRWVGRFLVYGSYDPVADADIYLRTYTNHERDVRAFFADRPDKLLVMCVENGDGYPELCNFLGIDEIPAEPFPHANRAPDPLTEGPASD